MISAEFTPLQALRIAVDMELAGYDFYMRAMELSSREDMREMMQRLALEELRHQRIFQEMYEERSAEDADSRPFDEEISTFLSAVAADIVFSGGMMKVMMETDMDDAAAVLREGIGSEKNACLFYSRMIEYARDEESREVFAEILAEEEKHLVDLTDILERVLSA